MKKRIFAFLLAAIMVVAVFTGCDETDPKESGTEAASTSNHVHVPAQEGVFDRTNGVNHYFICKDCGETVKEKHSYEWVGDVNGHIKVCACGQTGAERFDHNMEKGKCTNCGWENDPNHTHNFVTTGIVDISFHNVLCNDCGRVEKQVHDLVTGLDGDEHYYSCHCGYRSENFPHDWYEDDKCNHCEAMGIFGHECVYNTFVYIGDLHYEACECGKRRPDGVSHEFGEYTGGVNGHSHECITCGYAETNPHSFDDGFFLTDSCSICEYALPFSSGLEFEENGGGYTLIGMGSCTDKLVIVPETYNGKAVTAIGSSTFEGNTNILYVKLPDSIKSIGSSAFAGCTSLKAVNIPEGVTVIRDNTFMGCTSLEGVYITASITDIEMFAFMGCTSFKGFRHEFNSSTYDRNEHSIVWNVGEYAFKDCKSLKGLLFFYEGARIENGAFSGCTSIESVILAETIGGSVFSGCTSLKTVDAMGSNVEYFEIGTFNGCTSLETIKFGYGNLEDYLHIFADSVVDEEMGLSWYEGCPDFTVEIIDSPFESGVDEVVASMKISELYEYIDENYWQ